MTIRLTSTITDNTAWPDYIASPKDGDVIQLEGDFSSWPNLIIDGVNRLTLYGSAEMPYLDILNCTGATVDGLTVNEGCSLRSSNNCVFRNLKSDRQFDIPIRIWYESSNNVIEDCYLRRDGPGGDVNDRVGILLSDGANLNNTIRRCQIINYTDSIQTIDKQTGGDSPGYAAGLLIEDCQLGFEVDVGNEVGSENALDFKHGGTAGNHVTVKNCRMYGTRMNDANDAAVVVIHRMAQYIDFVDCTFQDCQSGVFLNTLSELPGQSSFVTANNCRWSFIKGRSDPHVPAKNGVALTGNNPAIFTDCRFDDCDELEENPGSNTFNNCTRDGVPI